MNVAATKRGSSVERSLARPSARANRVSRRHLAQTHSQNWYPFGTRTAPNGLAEHLRRRQPQSTPTNTITPWREGVSVVAGAGFEPRLVGSANLTHRALTANLEAGVLIEDPDLAGGLEEHVLNLMADGTLALEENPA